MRPYPITPPVATMSIVDIGRTCAVAAIGQRDLAGYAAAHPEVFPPGPFDPALFGAVAQAIAVGGAGLAAPRLRLTNRMALWAFAVDRLIDHVITTPAEVADVVDRCLVVGRGGAAVGGGGAVVGGEGAAVDPLTRCLAEVRDELAEAPGFRRFGPAWREELATCLGAMARERRWRAERREVDLDSYLDNADNVGLVLVFTAHAVAIAADGSAPTPGSTPTSGSAPTSGWARTSGSAPTPRPPADLLAAARTVQRALRIINDIGSLRRDRTTGDLNALLLGTPRADVDRRLAGLVRDARDRLAALRTTDPDLVGYLDRTLDFSLGFHPVAEYWGAESTGPAAGAAR